MFDGKPFVAAQRNFPEPATLRHVAPAGRMSSMPSAKPSSPRPPNTKPQWTSAIKVRQAKSGPFNPDETAWKLMSSSAEVASMTRVELRALRRLAEARRRASLQRASVRRGPPAKDVPANDVATPGDGAQHRG